MCKEGKEEKEEESRAHKRENTHAGNHVVRTLIKKRNERIHLLIQNIILTYNKL